MSSDSSFGQSKVLAIKGKGFNAPPHNIEWNSKEAIYFGKTKDLLSKLRPVPLFYAFYKGQMQFLQSHFPKAPFLWKNEKSPILLWF